MHRHPQWEQRLAEFAARHRSKAFKWGSVDCMIFAANAVKAVTGKDYARGHRGKYKSPLGAAKHLKGLGYTSPEAMLDALLDEKIPAFAQRGDIVLAKDGIPAVCMGAFAISIGGDENVEGLIKIPRSHWVKAWGVGDHHSGECACPNKGI